MMDELSIYKKKRKHLFVKFEHSMGCSCFQIISKNGINMSTVEQLEKNWKGMLAGMAVMASPGAGHAQATSDDSAKPAKVDLSTVHPELVPISHLESSGGTNLNHKPGPGGELDSAVGHLGLKPKTAM